MRSNHVTIDDTQIDYSFNVAPAKPLIKYEQTFRTELNNILVNYSLHLGSDVFCRYLMEQSGLEYKDQTMRAFFGDTQEKYGKIRFFIPTILSNEDKERLLIFCGITQEKSKKRPIELSTEEFCNQVLPGLPAYLDKLKNNAALFLRLQLLSKRAIESNAIEESKKKIAELITDLNSDMDEKPTYLSKISTANKIKLLPILTSLKEIIGHLSEREEHYFYQMQPRLEELIKFHEQNKDNVILSRELKFLIRQIEIYLKHTLVESRAALDAFFKSDHKQTWVSGINFQACSLIEETLVRLAGIDNIPKEPKVEKNRYNGCVEISFYGLSDEDEKKFEAFFQKFPYAAVQMSHYSESSQETFKCMSSSYKEPEAQKPNRCRFSIDAKVFSKEIFPLVLEEVTRLEKEKPEIFKSYQLKSKKYWLNKQGEKISTYIRLYTSSLNERLPPEENEDEKAKDKKLSPETIEDIKLLLTHLKQLEEALTNFLKHYAANSLEENDAEIKVFNQTIADITKISQDEKGFIPPDSQATKWIADLTSFISEAKAAKTDKASQLANEKYETSRVLKKTYDDFVKVLTDIKNKPHNQHFYFDYESVRDIQKKMPSYCEIAHPDHFTPGSRALFKFFNPSFKEVKNLLTATIGEDQNQRQKPRR